jgi:hypothetical protein
MAYFRFNHRMNGVKPLVAAALVTAAALAPTNASADWYLLNGSKRTCILAAQKGNNYASPLALEQYSRGLGAYDRTDVTRDAAGVPIMVAVVLNHRIDDLAFLYFHDERTCQTVAARALGTAPELSGAYQNFDDTAMQRAKDRAAENLKNGRRPGSFEVCGADHWQKDHWEPSCSVR